MTPPVEDVPEESFTPRTPRRSAPNRPGSTESDRKNARKHGFNDRIHFCRSSTQLTYMNTTAASPLVVEAGSAPTDAPAVADLDDDCVLVPLLRPTGPAVAGQLRVAASLSRTSDAPLCVVDPVEGTPTAYGPDLAADAERELVTRAVRTGCRPHQLGLSRTRRLVNGILSAIRGGDVETVVIPSGTRSGSLRRNLAEHLGLRAACDIVTVNGRRSYDDVQSILLPVTGGPHSGAAADVTRRIATDHDAWVDVLHVVSADATERQRRRAADHVASARDRIDRPERTSTWVLEAEDVTDAIVDQSEYYGLTVIGAPTKGRLREFILGSTSRTVRHGARSPVISVRTDE